MCRGLASRKRDGRGSARLGHRPCHVYVAEGMGCVQRGRLWRGTQTSSCRCSATSAERPLLQAPCWPFQSDRGSLQAISCCGHAEQRVPKPVTTSSEEGLVCGVRAGHLAQRGSWALETNTVSGKSEGLQVEGGKRGRRRRRRKEGVSSEACRVQTECPLVQCTQENTSGNGPSSLWGSAR